MSHSSSASCITEVLKIYWRMRGNQIPSLANRAGTAEKLACEPMHMRPFIGGVSVNLYVKTSFQYTMGHVSKLFKRRRRKVKQEPVEEDVNLPKSIAFQEAVKEVEVEEVATTTPASELDETPTTTQSTFPLPNFLEPAKEEAAILCSQVADFCSPKGHTKAWYDDMGACFTGDEGPETVKEVKLLYTEMMGSLIMPKRPAASE